MSGIKFTKDHEWISVDGDTATIGITAYAQEQLGDVVFVEVPETGKTVAQGDEAGVVESVKAASEVYAPVSGEVVDANADLEDNPALVNQDPQSGGWFFRLRLSDEGELDGLMDEAAYKAYIEELD
ncbi:MAG: glycine cleavage system protein H [Rhizobiales bacterium TMED143]|nr:glycine cleavage system protein H [Rhodobiaceae bacterium]MBL6787581.1 glycine cleavage system protein GcvH [PS1 clade bacterium]OUV93146.1 MAG: glycine cleavage system protein H [Rhizobiales bacterium TMED143]CAI8394252.1 MAG: Glycine cleavage system H protein [Rhodobiaceae bacterium UBA7378]HCQ81181.1 glycine cleavage system protein GcvH [Rhodobiaceae bacterium]|tara:strand:+ start:2108 stop:2485 length:378 start_codon:yes stop_codon:yes gene_type:complete